MYASAKTEGIYSSDTLIEGDCDCMATKKVTMKAGAAYQRGALIGRITATNKWVLSTAAAADGSEVPRAILADNVDATAADTEGMVYLSGSFNPDVMIFGAGHTAQSVEDGLRNLSIYLRRVMPA